MSSIPVREAVQNDYPTRSPEVPESEAHRDLMWVLIETLKRFFVGMQVYATGDLLVFSQRGNRRKHLSPDVWVARGVSPHQRDNYLIWEEPRGPEFVIELMSPTTQSVDETTKITLYRDVLKVREYFLFDPRPVARGPRLVGYRLRQGEYRPIRARDGRLPSQVTGLHLEADGATLRLWDPATGAWVPTQAELLEQVQEQTQALQEQAETFQEQAETLHQENQNLQRRVETAEDRTQRLLAQLREAGIEPAE